MQSILSKRSFLSLFGQEEAPGFNYNSRQRLARIRFDDDLEAKALAERRIINAKKASGS